MEEPKNNDVRSGELVPQQVTVNPKFANLARVEFTESWASPAELQQGFWRLAEFFLDLVGTNRVIARYEIGETIDNIRSDYPGLLSISSVWIARTVAWTSEGYFGFHLIWPLDKALEHQEWYKGEAV